MKAFTILVACVVAAAVASLPADAAKRKKRMHAAPAAASVNPNENSARFVRDALPVFLPGGGLMAASQQREKVVVRRKARRHR